MSTLSKSIKKVAKEALVIGEGCFKSYSCSISPQTYRQSQLFACLALKEHLQLDYRGISEFLRDFKEIRDVLGLNSVPHFTTLQKSGARLLNKGAVRSLLEETLFLYTVKKTT